MIFFVIVRMTIKRDQIDETIMLNDGISIGSIVSVNSNENHIISHLFLHVALVDDSWGMDYFEDANID